MSEGSSPTPTGSDPVKSSESLFETTSEIEYTRWDKYRRGFDSWVLAPAKIVIGDWRGKVGISFVTLHVLLGTVGVLYLPGTAEYFGDPFRPWFTTLAHPLGTDSNGRDLLLVMVHAEPPMLKMILSGGVFATFVATVVGTVSGYEGGTIDKLLMTFTDIMLTVPGLPLVIVIALIFEPRSPILIGILLTINTWAGLARTVRSQVLSTREDAFVEAAKIQGLPTHKVIANDILPTLMPYILINFVGAARGVIFRSVGLYFLGFLPYTNENWGVVLNNAYQQGALYASSTVHWILVPIIFIGTLSLGMILLSQSFDRIFNPRVRAKHQKTTSSETDVETTP